MLVTKKHHEDDIEFLTLINQINLDSLKMLTRVVETLIAEVKDMREELDFLIDELESDD
jgi:hypothetical protein